MKIDRLKTIILVFLLGIIAFLIDGNYVYAKTKACNGEQCISCTYSENEDDYRYSVTYFIQKSTNGSITGEYEESNVKGATLDNKISDYSFFLNNATNQLECKEIGILHRETIEKSISDVTAILGMMPSVLTQAVNKTVMGIFGINSYNITFYVGSDFLETVSDINEAISPYVSSTFTTITPSSSVDLSHINYVCDYRGKINGQSLSIANTDSGWIVTYPDNAQQLFDSSNSTNFPSSNCEDIFYSKNDNSIRTVDANSQYANVYIAQFCNAASDLEQYCKNGTCQIADASCGNSGSTTTNSNGCPSELVPIIFFLKKVAFNTLQIFVPILLIVMGTIDFVKAVASPDDKGNKEATSKFIKRVLAAILCFFVVTIVTIVMDMFAKTDVGEQSSWKACWFDIG